MAKLNNFAGGLGGVLKRVGTTLTNPKTIQTMGVLGHALSPNQNSPLARGGLAAAGLAQNQIAEQQQLEQSQAYRSALGSIYPNSPLSQLNTNLTPQTMNNLAGMYQDQQNTQAEREISEGYLGVQQGTLDFNKAKNKESERLRRKEVAADIALRKTQALVNERKADAIRQGMEEVYEFQTTPLGSAYSYNKMNGDYELIEGPKPETNPYSPEHMRLVYNDAHSHAYDRAVLKSMVADDSVEGGYRLDYNKLQKIMPVEVRAELEKMRKAKITPQADSWLVQTLREGGKILGELTNNRRQQPAQQQQPQPAGQNPMAPSVNERQDMTVPEQSGLNTEAQSAWQQGEVVEETGGTITKIFNGKQYKFAK